MFDEDDYEQMYQSAVDDLDVKYIDGVPYINIHTVDIINESLLTMIEHSEKIAASGGPGLPEETVQGLLWVMHIWGNLHDELEVRAETMAIPDHVPDDLDKGN